jgi:3-hydroxyacyl-[acyl-carrier protein] dehydratase / trans-2-decenoyl-[acyl-carrier protein] isomerase
MMIEQAVKPMKEKFEQKSSYGYDELITFAHSNFEGQGDSRLPLPPMLMLDRITNISLEGGVYGKGVVEAELDIRPDLWFFECHFEEDPVMPGCLGLDAMWQLLGFFLGWTGAPGTGRALGLGGLKLTGQVQPDAALVKYVVDIKRVINRKLVLGIGDGKMLRDGEVIYEATDLKVGLFGNPEAL